MKFFKNKENAGYFFILPFFIVFLIFSLYPILYTLVLSFSAYDGLSEITFKGLENYTRLFKDKYFYEALYNTWRIWIFNMLPQVGIALLLAAMFTYNKIRGQGFFKAVFYFPNLVTAASIALLFNVLLDWQNGTINQILMGWNIIKEPINWLNTPFHTRNTVSLIQWWMWFGQTMIICLAGIAAIPGDYYEAAIVDGATKWQVFWKITLPLLKPTLIYVMITSLIGGMQIFDIPMILTDGQGAPQGSINTMVMYLYNQAFRFNNFGYAAAVAYTLFAIIGVVSVFSLKIVNKKG